MTRGALCVWRMGVRAVYGARRHNGCDGRHRRVLYAPDEAAEHMSTGVPATQLHTRARRQAPRPVLYLPEPCGAEGREVGGHLLLWSRSAR